MTYSITLKTTPSPPARATAMEPTDAVVIALSLRDPQQFGVLFDRHWASVHAYCTSRAGAAGEDIAAEVFRLAFVRRHRYDPHLGGARAWLYAITTNLLRHHFRSLQRGERAGRRAHALERLRYTAEPFERLEAQMLGPRLAAALRSLAEIDREALLLLAWAELDYQEIAGALGVPLGTVRSRIHRARQLMRTHIAVTHEGDSDDA